MSWWISLSDPETGQPLKVESFQEGGTQIMGGSSEADLNVTYNYSPHYYRVLGLEKGLRSLDGMTAEEAIPILESGVAQLGTDEDSDYWKATEGNARKALALFSDWCRQAVVQGKGSAPVRVS